MHKTEKRYLDALTGHVTKFRHCKLPSWCIRNATMIKSAVLQVLEYQNWVQIKIKTSTFTSQPSDSLPELANVQGLSACTTGKQHYVNNLAILLSKDGRDGRNTIQLCHKTT